VVLILIQSLAKCEIWQHQVCAGFPTAESVPGALHSSFFPQNVPSQTVDRGQNLWVRWGPSRENYMMSADSFDAYLRRVYLLGLRLDAGPDEERDRQRTFPTPNSRSLEIPG